MAGALRRVWIPAARPKTLAAAVAPVLIGTGIAIHQGGFHAGAAMVTLLATLCIQIGTNFANDYFDFLKGTDTDERLGPQRATHAGLVAPETMRAAFLIVFGVALVLGAYLVWRGGWPVVAIGLVSIACGILYTGGPAPLAQVGLADLFVFAFFGVVAVAGTYYVQALSWNGAAFVAGIGPGLLAVALLTVNNLRDIETDRAAGRRTLPVRFGVLYAKRQYAYCLLGAATVPVVLWHGFDAPAGVWAATVVCLFGIKPIGEVFAARPGHRLEGALAGTGRLLVLYGVALTAGWVL